MWLVLCETGSTVSVIRDRECTVDLLLKDSDPVDATKPAMSLDIIDAVLEITVSLAQVRLQQVFYQIFQVGTEMPRKPNLRTNICTAAIASLVKAF